MTTLHNVCRSGNRSGIPLRFYLLHHLLFLQKRGPMPPDMYAAAEWSPDSQSAFSFKMLKGMETSVQYFKVWLGIVACMLGSICSGNGWFHFGVGLRNFIHERQTVPTSGMG